MSLTKDGKAAMTKGLLQLRFNGTEMKIGSVADGENLEEDYTNMARVSPG